MKAKAGKREYISYAAGSMGISMLLSVTSAYLMIYMTNVAYLDIAIVSAILAVSRVFDGISDIIIGNIIDNSTSRLGKARSWLLRMTLPYTICVFLLFHVPGQWPEMVKYIYVFLIYNLTNTLFYSFVSISHYALLPLITEDHMEHGILGMIQSVMMNIGMMCGSIFFVRLLGFFSDDPGNQNTQRAYTWAVLIFCLIMLLLTMLMVLFTKEKKAGTPAGKDRAKGIGRGQLSQFKEILLNRNWLTLVICTLLCYIILHLRVTGATYYALYILDDMTRVGWLNAFNMGASIVTQLLTPFLMRRYGMKKVYCTGILLAIAGLLGFAATTGSIPAMSAFLILGGVGNGCYHAMMPGLLAVIITDIAEKTGHMQAGMGNAGMAASNKLGQGLGNAIFGMMLAAVGFNAALDTQGIKQPAAVLKTISSLYIWLPLLLYVIVFLVFVFFFDKEKRIGI